MRAVCRDAARARSSRCCCTARQDTPEWKALDAACEAERIGALRLLRACGAIPSTHDYHFNRFLAEAFPHGTGFPAWGSLPPMPELPVRRCARSRSTMRSTTEIDDAFSVRELPGGHREIGIHIAAPALLIPRGTPLDAHCTRSGCRRCTCRAAS